MLSTIVTQAVIFRFQPNLLESRSRVAAFCDREVPVVKRPVTSGDFTLFRLSVVGDGFYTVAHW